MLCLLVSFSLVSCKKDSPSTVDLSGTSWTGSFVYSYDAPRFNTVHITLNANTSIIGNTDTTHVSPITGFWSKTPNSNVVYMEFTTDEATGSYTGEAILSDDQKKLTSGTGTNSGDASYNLTFELTRN